MVKQLGESTFFVTLSSVELRWNELISLINKLKQKDLSAENNESLSCHERSQLLNSNPVLIARLFQYRIEVFFKKIALDGSINENYGIRVEFPVRSSPRAHCFLWVLSMHWF